MKRHDSMRGYFFHSLYEQMKTNEDIVALSGDLGYGGFDAIREEFPDRFFNMGASEFTMVGAAVGMAYEGKIPFVYSITPFLLARPYEIIRNYVDREQVAVKLIGSGRDHDYAHDGFSHWAGDDRQILRNFSNIETRWPETKEELPDVVEWAIRNQKPTYINLSR